MLTPFTLFCLMCAELGSHQFTVNIGISLPLDLSVAAAAAARIACGGGGAPPQQQQQFPVILYGPKEHVSQISFCISVNGSVMSVDPHPSPCPSAAAAVVSSARASSSVLPPPAFASVASMSSVDSKAQQAPVPAADQQYASPFALLSSPLPSAPSSSSGAPAAIAASLPAEPPAYSRKVLSLVVSSGALDGLSFYLLCVFLFWSK